MLDPMCGSGTTLVVAKMINRRLWDRFRLPVNEIAKSKPWDLHYLGFDISPEYCEMARRRLAELEEPLERFIEG